MRVFAESYSSAMPVLTILAVAGLAACGMRRGRSRRQALVVLTLAWVVACAYRIALVSQVDVSLWHSISAYYWSSATPFVVVLVTLDLYLAARRCELHPRRLEWPVPLPSGHDAVEGSAWQPLL